MTAEDDRSESSLASFISLSPGVEVVPHLVRLIAQGQPVALEDLAASAALLVADVEGVRLPRSREAGRDWASAHPDGRVFTVSDAFQCTLRGCREPGWVAPERAAR